MLFEQNGELTYAYSKYARANSFLTVAATDAPLPDYAEIKGLLPKPVWQGHEAALAAYDYAWETAFGNLRKPTAENGFVSNYIDTAFNNCIFMWDSAFILMFGRYARSAFNFQGTLDNFYTKQHKDGFICREIDEKTGMDRFTRFDPSATGPNIMPWCEWDYYETTGDKDRLSRCFDPLMALYLWMKANYTWRDGSYFSSGWGCGIDNMPRLEKGYNTCFSHGHMIWADVCLQQLFAAKTLRKAAEVLGKGEEIALLGGDIKRLEEIVNGKLWDSEDCFYYDLWKDDRKNGVKSIGAYWALLADCVPEDGLEGFVAHLDNEKEFKRTHRVPVLSADNPSYCPDGNYWRGSVWAPTNYMVLKGLSRRGYGRLAHEIALNHNSNVCKVYENTGTLWENYAPEAVSEGKPAKPNFVGWTGLSCISVLFEFVFGIEANVTANEIVWNVRLTERHGVERYPFGREGEVSLVCYERSCESDEPIVTASSTVPLRLRVVWEGGEKVIRL